MRRILIIACLVIIMLIGCSNQENGNYESSDTASDAPDSMSAPESGESDTELADKASDMEGEDTMQIKVTDGANVIIFHLNGSSAAKSLYEQLPLTVEVENYGSNEKIFYPPATLDTSDVIEGGGPMGTLAYFSPWGNVVMYYGSFGSYPGLYIMGEATKGAENIQSLSGTITVTAE